MSKLHAMVGAIPGVGDECTDQVRQYLDACIDKPGVPFYLCLSVNCAWFETAS